MSDPIKGFVLKSIGTNLVIRDGVVATQDGRHERKLWSYEPDLIC